MYDFRTFERELLPKWMEQFKSNEGLGEFSFEIGGPTSLYGTTDMLISSFILDDLLLSENQRDKWAKVINQFQNPKTGWYSKKYALHHFKEHTSAYAVAALFLIDRQPKYPFSWKYDILKSEKAQAEVDKLREQFDAAIHELDAPGPQLDIVDGAVQVAGALPIRIFGG